MFEGKVFTGEIGLCFEQTLWLKFLEHKKLLPGMYTVLSKPHLDVKPFIGFRYSSFHFSIQPYARVIKCEINVLQHFSELGYAFL